MGRVLRVAVLLLSAFVALEGAAAGATFTVTSTADTAAAGTLRSAITQANATTAHDEIGFAIPGAGPHTIGLGSDLPTITQPVTIDGYTQAGAAENTDTIGSNAVLRIVIDANEARGLVVTGGNTTISGLVIHDAQGPPVPVPGTGITQFVGDGITLDSGGNRVEGNFIGTTVTGGLIDSIEDRNRSAAVRVISGSGNVIGGSTPQQRNVLSGNGDFVSSEGEGGVIVNGGTGTVVAGNRIGTNPAGTAEVPNSQFGVYANGFNPGGTIANTTVGGTEAGAGNLISGNGNSGVEFIGAGTGNRVLGNRIGTNAAGTAALPNLGQAAIRADEAVQIGDDAGHGNLVSGNAAYGIQLFGSGHTVQGNSIGTNAAGTAAIANGNDGIRLHASASTIGGTTAGARNVISGNGGAGIGGDGGSDNLVQGNYIGTNAAGTAAVANEGGGIVLQNATDNTVGGTTAAAGNLVSGNELVGVAFSLREGGPNEDNLVLSNRIGLDKDGAALGNDGPGVLILGGLRAVVGRPGQGNTISGNTGDGVVVLGQDGVGSNDRNQIRGNSIWANGGLGIDLGGDTSDPANPGDGVTANDVGDADGGNNQRQNFPLVNAADSGPGAAISGSLSSAASTTYTIDVYESSECDASGNGEARTPVAAASATTNATGTATWTATGDVPAGRFVTATATDPDGNTSELSACRAAGPTADLSLTFAASSLNPAASSQVTFTTTVQNGAGGAAASGVTVDAKLPPGYVFVSATPAAAYDAGTGVWTIGALAAGGSAQLQVVARVDDGSPNDVFAEVRTADQADPDSVPGNRAAGEDDYGVQRVRAPGIWVNHNGTAITPADGRCTLIEAINAANLDLASGSVARECAAGSGADTIHLQDAETYALTVANNTRSASGAPNALPLVSTPITILGNGSRIRRASGASDFRLFYVTETGSLRLEDATVSHGRSTLGERCGGGIFSVGALTLIDSKVELNVATAGNDTAVGGGICQLPGTLSLVRTTVSENISSANSTAGGGGVYAQSATVTVTDSDIRQNLVQAGAGTGSGAGVYVQGGSLGMTGSTVRGNVINGGPGSTWRVGGGLFLTLATATITDTTIGGSIAAHGNQALTGGGIAVHSPSTKLTMTRGALQENVANGEWNTVGGGGAVANGTGHGAGGEVTLNSVAVSGNRAPGADGGGVFNRGVLEVTGGSLSSNVALSGGGLSNGSGAFTGGTATVDGATIAQNAVTRGGGGVSVAGGTVELDGAAVDRNVATTGGGIQVNSGQLKMADTAVAASLASAGGGLYVRGGAAEVSGSAITASAVSYAGGGVLVTGGSFAMDGGEIRGNTAFGHWSNSGGGAGLANGGTADPGVGPLPGGTVTLTDVLIRLNNAPNGDGGGVFNRATLNVTGSTIHDNQAVSGGGLANGTGAITGGDATVYNTDFGQNRAGATGGAISASTGKIDIALAELVGNSAVGEGGGIASAFTSQITMRDSNLRNNRAANGGGLAGGGQVSAVRIDVLDNQAELGGGVYVAPAGAPGSFLFLAGAVVDGNEASGSGGGAYTRYPATLTLSQTQVTRNTAGSDGGGVGNGGIFNLYNSTISANSAGVRGGGVANFTVAPTTTWAAFSSTIADNVAPAGGGFAGSSLAKFWGSIVVGNRDPSGVPADCLGGEVSESLGGNIWADGSACPRRVGSDRRIDSRLAFTEVLEPLAANGSRMHSHQPLPGSPALDIAGVVKFDGSGPCTLDYDQRGRLRPVDGDGDGSVFCDAGAVEVQSARPAPLRLHELSPAAAAGGGGPLMLTVRGAGFDGDSVVRWNGSPRPTTLVSPAELRADIPASDLVGGALIRVAEVTVAGTGGATTRALPVTVRAPIASAVDSNVVAEGGAGSATSLPSLPAAAATVRNAPGGGPVTVTAATYSANPAGGTAFDAGGFVDLQVIGAGPGDSADVTFYYPKSVGAAEAALTLRYWTGSAWAPVLSSGGAAPSKSTVDDQDGTASGGSFRVVFDETSTPKLADLSGTVMAWTDDTPPVAPSPGGGGGGGGDPPVFPADTTPPEAALAFDPAKRDVVVRDRTAVRSAAVKPSRSTRPRKGKSRRTYSLRDGAGNTLTMVVEVKRSRSALSAKVLSLRYGGDARTRRAGKNSVSYRWTLRGRRVRKLTQVVSAGRRKVTARYDGAKRRTTITDTAKRRRPLTKRGLVPIRLESAAGNLAVGY